MFRSNASDFCVLCTDNNSKAAQNWEVVKWLHAREWKEWDTKDTAQRCLKVVEQLEPKQAAWKWMPLICLGNYKGTLEVNGPRCWVLAVVQESGNAAAQQEMPRHGLVVPAPTLQEAKQKVVGKSLQQLLCSNFCKCCGAS